MRIDKKISSIDNIDIHNLSPYNAVLAYETSSGAVRAFGLVVNSISHSVQSVTASDTQTRFANIISSGYYHVLGPITVKGAFRSQAENNRFGGFIREWHYDILRRSTMCLLRFVCDIDGSVVEHDVIVDAANIKYGMGDGAINFSLNLMRGDKYSIGDSSPNITRAHSSYVETLKAGELIVGTSSSSKYTSGYSEFATVRSKSGGRIPVK